MPFTICIRMGSIVQKIALNKKNSMERTIIKIRGALRGAALCAGVNKTKLI